MKVRVKVPEKIVRDMDSCKSFVDDILLWGMETGMDAEFYTYFYPDQMRDWKSRDKWAVFSVDADHAFMFALKWGALQHKGKARKITI